MKKLARFIFNMVRGVYTILATYLLAFVLPFALAGFAFHLGFEVIANLLEFETVDDLWYRASEWLPFPTVYARILLFLPLHVATWWVMRGPVAKVWPYLEKGFDKLHAAWEWFTRKAPGLEVAGELLFTLVVTALLIPFVIQPTLVPTYTTAHGWIERTANLLDGTATAEIADSVVGLYRRLYADPVVTEGLSKQEQDVFDQSVEPGFEQPDGDIASGPITSPKPNGQQPLMDRWDPYISEVAGGDPSKFAYIKAFMWVESGGRQYAVSVTGCAGLMQFCTGTAKSPRFKPIFGTGTVYRCNCPDGKCRIPREAQRDLESGDPDAFDRHKKVFPCEMTDARFNPKKIIAAGGRYVDDLHGQFGGNIYLMYIGYNSGPGVARYVWEKTGRNPDVTLAEIDQHLADGIRKRTRLEADGRARGLVDTHLPKLARAYQRYYEPGAKGTPTGEKPPKEPGGEKPAGDTDMPDPVVEEPAENPKSEPPDDDPMTVEPDPPAGL